MFTSLNTIVCVVPVGWSVMRGTWFEVSSSDKWYPVKEEDAAIIEEAHTRRGWREKVSMMSS